MTRREAGSAGNRDGCISLQNELLSVSVLPAAGGNISELVDLRTGRNWLWENPHIPISAARTGGDYGRDLDSGGWDEVLLSVTPDTLELPDRRELRIPDHGDLVRQRWSVSKTSNGAARCDLQVNGELLNYDFARHISLADERARMHVQYALTNNDTFAWPWYWCAHALISVQPGMRIDLPAAQPFRVDNPHREPDSPEQMHRWPEMHIPGSAPLDLSKSFSVNDAPAGFAAKIFVESPANGAVSVTAPAGDEKLIMTFDRRQLPWLGLWINHHGWSGCGSAPYLNLGLEPATTPYDSVADAIQNDAIEWLQPGETRSWSLCVELAG